LPEPVAGCRQARRCFGDFPRIIAIIVLRITMMMAGQEERSGVIPLTITA